jgi:hypothetical protein
MSKAGDIKTAAGKSFKLPISKQNAVISQQLNQGYNG